VELLLGLAVVHALDHFRPYERCLGDNALEGHHVIELVRAERPRIARELAEAANVGAVVDDIVRCLLLGAVGECLDDVLECAVEGFYKIERFVQEAVGGQNCRCSEEGEVTYPSASSRLCDLISLMLTVSLRSPRFSITRISGR
jgi:hypothetical protein